MFDKRAIAEIESKIVVSGDPFPNAIIKDFLPFEAIKKAAGEIIAFLDVDDWWNKDKLEKQIPLFDDSKVGLVYSNLYLFYENNKKKEIYKNKILKKGHITLDLLRDYNIGILTVLIRKVAYNSVSGFNNQYEFSGDFDLIIRLSTKWKIDCRQEPLACYRIHSKNFTFVNNVNNTIEIKELEKWILDEKISSDENLKPHLHYINKRINLFEYAYLTPSIRSGQNFFISLDS